MKDSYIFGFARLELVYIFTLFLMQLLKLDEFIINFCPMFSFSIFRIFELITKLNELGFNYPRMYFIDY